MNFYRCVDGLPSRLPLGDLFDPLSAEENAELASDRECVWLANDTKSPWIDIRVTLKVEGESLFEIALDTAEAQDIDTAQAAGPGIFAGAVDVGTLDAMQGTFLWVKRTGTASGAGLDRVTLEATGETVEVVTGDRP